MHYGELENREWAESYANEGEQWIFLTNAFDSAHMKYEIWTWPKSQIQAKWIMYDARVMMQ